MDYRKWVCGGSYFVYNCLSASSLEQAYFCLAKLITKINM